MVRLYPYAASCPHLRVKIWGRLKFVSCGTLYWMKKLYIPSDESELVFLKSVLEADEIPFYVQNENFGSLYSGTYMSFFNAKTVMVPEDYYDEAKEIISSVIDNAEFVDAKCKEPPPLSSVLKNLISFITLGLYTPGKNNADDNDATGN